MLPHRCRFALAALTTAILSAGLGQMAQVAHAADIPSAAQPTARRPVVAAVTNWTGFYVGGNVGYGWAKSDWTFQNDSFWNNAPGEPIGLRPKGWLGGAQLGFNYQINQWVFGIEGTWSAASIKQTVVSPYFPALDTETTKVKSLSTLAGRVGVAWDRALIYGKGGWAGGRVELSAASTVGPTFWNPGTQSRSGHVLGAGLEFMLMPNWILGVEYNHINLRTKNYAANDTGGSTSFTTVDDKTKVNTVAARLSYLFDWGRR
jgi:outer membrane immunogenic protein